MSDHLLSKRFTIGRGRLHCRIAIQFVAHILGAPKPLIAVVSAAVGLASPCLRRDDGRRLQHSRRELQWGDCGEPERQGACLLPRSLLFYFCRLIRRVSPLVFLLVSAAIDDEKYFKFR
jgi:hypothetical protein